MSSSFLETPVEYLKGVGPQRAGLLKSELRIFTFGDLLQHFPFRHADRSKFYTIKEINADLPYIQIKGVFTGFRMAGEKRAKRLVGIFKDETAALEVVWFRGIKWIQGSLKTNTEYVLFGKPSVFNGIINLVHPEVEKVSDQTDMATATLHPVYSTTEKLKNKGLDSRGISKLIRALLLSLPQSLPETLPEKLRTSLKLIPWREALLHVHQPPDAGHLKTAQLRLKFEEFFFIQLKLLKYKVDRKEKIKGHRFATIGNYFNRFYHEKLPYELTGAQKRVLKEIRQDVGSGAQMNRLLQGDVGSGKTLVALMSMLMAVDNNTQACLMAPTEILAGQHLQTISTMLEGIGLQVGLLTGSTKGKARKAIHDAMRDGSLHILIGTHALIEDEVQFQNLGLVVIDEQHRFGVEQRARLWQKNTCPPHVLVMTATPIPRTLAMTLYGDLDTSVIDELPPGRKPVKTLHRYDSARLLVYEFLKKEIALGRQVYIVYPLIEESETLDYKNLMDSYDQLCIAFPRPKYQTSILHGRMKAAAKEFEMQRFLKGETHIMVATTVIEVGVNIPNASVMVIESAERFGLSQLHQLRGRVGRGAEQSYCILMTSHKLSSEARVRIDTLVRTNDGFEVADTDLKLRGPGDVTGTQQSGILNLRIADISKDAPILQLARKTAEHILANDAHLSSPANACLRDKLHALEKESGNWGKIS